MSIEVKQLIIKSTVVNGRSEPTQQQRPPIDVEQLKRVMMEECKNLIAASLSDQQER